MQELIKYIGDILNIKTDSVYTIQDMTEELSKIKDIVAYRSYIKDNLASIEVDYKTGFQKFIILTKEYLSLEFEAEAKNKFVLLVQDAKKNFRVDDVNHRVILNSDFDTNVSVLDLSAKIGRENLIIVLRNGIDAKEFCVGSKRRTILSMYIASLIGKNKSELPYNQLDSRLKEMTKRITK